MKYLWVRAPNNELIIVEDPISLFRGSQFDEIHDKLYQIGREVKMTVHIAPVSNTRQGDTIDSQDSTSASIPRSQGLKRDLGVGDYRG